MKEIQLIDWIKKNAGDPPKGVLVGVGDDCAVIERSHMYYSLWAADMLVEGTHFDLKRDRLEKVGRKAVAVNISDIAAMGGIPEYITVSLGVPRGMSMSSVRKIYKGIFDICSEFGISVVGGDTNGSRRLVIDVSIIGRVEKRRLLLRSKARPGDIILITGPVRDGKKSHTDFVPRLEFARDLTEKNRVNSMIDVSDGIGPDLGRLCKASSVGARVYAGAIPLSRGLELYDALYYGESFELLFTMSPLQVRKLYVSSGKKGKFPGCSIIGEIVPLSKGVKLVDPAGKTSPLLMKGFEHV
ncbi:MAG: thiamine-phosphate kinase [Candidatus Omnitrophica bacterium]|nr:thiamine-phosphate kinase [Candidatus Omnitrophota bacterium]